MARTTENQLTQAQLELLAAALLNTRGNVYQIVKERFGLKAGDSVFGRLYRHGLFRCEGCNTWLPIQDRCSETLGDVCNGCMEDD